MDVKRLASAQNLTAGVALNPEGQQVFIPAVLSASAASATSAVTTVASVSVDGGQMGPNGLLTVEMIGRFSNSAGSDRFLNVGPTAFGATLTSDNYVTGNTGALYYRGTLWNQNDEASQIGWGYMYLCTSAQIAHVVNNEPFPGANDTSQDQVWTFTFQMTGAGAISSVSWIVYGIRATTIYAPGF